jgi:hypothetical protein
MGFIEFCPLFNAGDGIKFIGILIVFIFIFVFPLE